ncbi:MAG TPA: hemerythrin domain-containing protein [Actinomycetota bacterium]|nr:hemerythrin domain-containing protein [Actinomycetota bacterium]
MTKRHESLIPLSHDHHHALAQARRLKAAASMTDVPERRRAADDFVNFYLGRLVRHFREEEELFFAPLVDRDEAGDQVMKAVAEHLRVHALARSLRRQLVDGEAEPETLSALSTLLTTHVRWEERDLLPLVERLLSQAELKELATVGRRDV